MALGLCSVVSAWGQKMWPRKVVAASRERGQQPFRVAASHDQMQWCLKRQLCVEHAGSIRVLCWHRRPGQVLSLRPSHPLLLFMLPGLLCSVLSATSGPHSWTESAVCPLFSSGASAFWGLWTPLRCWGGLGELFVPVATSTWVVQLKSEES